MGASRLLEKNVEFVGQGVVDSYQESEDFYRGAKGIPLGVPLNNYHQNQVFRIHVKALRR